MMRLIKMILGIKKSNKALKKSGRANRSDYVKSFDGRKQIKEMAKLRGKLILM